MQSEELVKVIQDQLDKGNSSKGRRIFDKLGIAALGAIPWVGGVIAAAASIPGEAAALNQDNLRTQWLKEHEKRLEQLRFDLDEIVSRLENLGPEMEARVQSPEYLALVRQAFHAWDQAETEDKRRYVGNLVSNSAGTRLCSDDVIRLFIGWLSLYHEAHFAVIREIFKNPGSSRYEIWTSLYGELPREDSAEADLFRLLIRDLSTGGVIRQARETTEDGQFIRHQQRRRAGRSSPVLESSFEDTKQYLLTELGKQFVHYTMNDVVARLDK